jgi:hypothetical protein
MSRKVLLWAHVTDEVGAAARELAEKKGVSVSEYLRNLVLLDLEKRGAFSKVKLQTRRFEESKREEAGTGPSTGIQPNVSDTPSPDSIKRRSIYE